LGCGGSGDGATSSGPTAVGAVIDKAEEVMDTAEKYSTASGAARELLTKGAGGGGDDDDDDDSFLEVSSYGKLRRWG